MTAPGLARRAVVSAPAFVGRDAELTTLLGALETPPALVLVEGEAGIGKTRLVQESLARLGRSERTVLAVACPPLREPFPLGPLVDALRRDVGRRPPAELSPLAGALRPLFPEWSDLLPPAPEPLADRRQAQHRLLRALRELIARLQLEALVVEDVHWADGVTLQWLLTLLAAGDSAMTVVVTYRPLEVAAGSVLKRLTSWVPGGMTYARIALGPLSDEEAHRLVTSMVEGGSVPERLAVWLHEQTDGLPLALEESVRLLTDRHGWGECAAQQLTELEVPRTLRDSVLERLERVSPEVRRVLEAAAVLGEPADEALLAAVADLPRPAARDALAAALATGLLHEATPDRFVSRHALDARAVAQAIPVSERRRHHRRAAEALEKMTPRPVARLSRHWREAGALEAWCRCAEAAADLALEAGDDRAAIAILREPLEAMEHPVERRARLTRKLGEAAVLRSLPLPEVLPIQRAMRAALDEEGVPAGERGEMRLLHAELLREIGEEQAAYAELEAAVPDLAHRPALAARAMHGLAMPLVPGCPAAWHRAWLRRARALLPDIVDPGDRIGFTGSAATALLLLGDERGWQAAAELPDMPPSGVSPHATATVLMNIAQVAMVWGRYEQGRQRLDAVTRLMRTNDLHRLMNTAHVAGAILDWYTGRWHGLRETAAQLEASDSSLSLDRRQARQVLALLDLVEGDRQAGESRLREVLDEYAQLGSLDPTGMLAAAALARVLLDDGRVAEAVAVSGAAVETIRAKQLWLWSADVAGVHTDALLAAEMRKEAEAFTAQLASSVQSRIPLLGAAVAACRASLTEDRGDHRAAAERFAAAGDAWAALPRPYDALLCFERRGRCLVAAGLTGDGITVLREAERGLREMGAKWDADRIVQALRRCGVRVARPHRGGRRGYGDQLSPRELEVVRLVARGMTNRQVAAALTLSRKTIDQHLSSAMRKVGVTSRTALAVTAAERGMLDTSG